MTAEVVERCVVCHLTLPPDSSGLCHRHKYFEQLPDSPVKPARSVALDVFRGLAILAMLADHLAYLTGGPEVIRLTVGRLAMPAFFILAGHLARRPRLRHAEVFVLGLVLPALVPWIDSPNVLCWWALGVVCLWLLGRLGWPAWLLVALPLTLGANGWLHLDGNGYAGSALFGLMALGAILPRSVFAWAGRLPRQVARPLAFLGRHPIAFYAGHLLALELLAFGTLGVR
jgi:hypothetical protein